MIFTVLQTQKSASHPLQIGQNTPSVFVQFSLDRKRADLRLACLPACLLAVIEIAEAVKQGVLQAGGIPFVFPAIAVCDGIAMGHEGMKFSLVTRELIADSTEAMATAHPFDGLVLIPNCDKNVPGLLMAAARLNIP